MTYTHICQQKRLTWATEMLTNGNLSLGAGWHPFKSENHMHPKCPPPSPEMVNYPSPLPMGIVNKNLLYLQLVRTHGTVEGRAANQHFNCACFLFVDIREVHKGQKRSSSSPYLCCGRQCISRHVGTSRKSTKESMHPLQVRHTHPYLSILVYTISYNRCPNTCGNTRERIEEKPFAAYWCCPPFWNDCCNITASFFNRPQVKKDNSTGQSKSLLFFFEF